jgi:hypothetical protein
MPARKPRPADEKPQIERFREAARELGCDDAEAAFDEKLWQIMKAKPVQQSAMAKGKRHSASE